MEEKRYLEMKSGKKYEIIGENGRFWLCKGTQFRKTNPDILRVSVKKTEAKKKKEE